MEESKIIIHNYEKNTLTDAEALYRIYKVIGEGLVSETRKGKQYCFVTRFHDDYVVTCDKTKTGYTFKIVKENNEI